MRRATLARTFIAAAACALVAVTFAACAHGDGYRGGTYTSFTFRPPAAATPRPADSRRPGPVPHRDLDRWIANDEAALRRTVHRSASTYGTHLASLLNGLWLAHRDGELAQRLATIGTQIPGGSDDRADARFFAGDRGAAFDVYALRGAELREARAFALEGRWANAIARVRGVHEAVQPDGRSIDAALLEGDAYAACGRYADARITWYRAFSTSVLQAPDRYRFFPEWTSAMRRLVRYRAHPDRTTPAPACRALPPPIVDPLG